jgi:hypothetical protein
VFLALTATGEGYLPLFDGGRVEAGEDLASYASNQDGGYCLFVKFML